METCTNIIDKIIFFEDLSAHEQQEVKNHTKICPKCRKYSEELQTIMSSLKKGQEAHAVDQESLLRYSLYLSAPKESDYDGRKLTQSEISEIRQHLAGCTRCRQKVEQFCQEYDAIEEYLEKTGLPALKLATTSPWSFPVFEKVLQIIQSVTQSLKNKISAPIPKLYPLAVGAAVAIMIMIWVGPFFRGSDNPYFNLASLGQERITVLTRSSLSGSMSGGLIAFHEGNYQKAIQELERFISKSSNDPSLFYAHYLLGISYLTEAKRELLGRFKKFDSKLVDKGIQNLQITQRLRDNLGIMEDCYWYLGKAYLMKGNVAKAKEAFESVISLRGRRFRDAQHIIKELDTVAASS